MSKTKKPRVPKVSELLPNAVIVIPPRPAQSTEHAEECSPEFAKKLQSSKKPIVSPKRTIKTKYQLPMTPSMSNIALFNKDLND